VIGTKGSVTWDGGEGFTAQVVAKTGGFFSQWDDLEIPPLHPEDRIGAHAGQIADFVDCVRTGRTPETTGSDNIKSLAMVFGAVESASQNAVVDVQW
jgi:predicted dehydrogenase